MAVVAATSQEAITAVTAAAEAATEGEAVEAEVAAGDVGSKKEESAPIMDETNNHDDMHRILKKERGAESRGMLQS